ncbi:MAG: hypothetical protein M0Q53_06665 [Prolixibacteraceae bacterium]|jgi:hypothetical protein|nr:hypothetical protein [Prolixibacteraceae bacterium]
MKPNVKLFIAVALLATACTTGSRVTSGGYSDDLYFTPGDAQPSTPKPVKQEKQPEKKSTVVMQVEENEQGKVVNNYIVPKSSRKDKNAYYFDDQPAYADTVMEYKDDKEQVTINNYYEGEEMNYSTRIRTFYNPYFYDPFWDPFWGGFYDPYFGSPFSWGLGWGGMYGGYYGGYYGGWYNPWNPWFGYGGYGYGGFGYGGFGYGYGWGGGYYPGWGWTSGSYYAGGGWSNGNYHNGKQNSTGKRGVSNAVRYGTNNTKSGTIYGSGAFNGQVLGRSINATSTRLQSTNGDVQGVRPGMGGVGATGTRQPSTREATVLQQNQAPNNMQGTRINRGETLSNLRRSGTNNIQSSGAVNQNNIGSRPVSSGRDYTPTYNRPRMNTQPSYNNGSTRQYNSPQYNSNTQGSRYARPQSSGGSFGGAVRTQQSNSYQRGAASSSPTRSSASPSSSSSGSSSSGRSYSPGFSGSSSGTRSFSTPSFGGGGNVGGSNSGGGHSGGGGGSGRSR